MASLPLDDEHGRLSDLPVAPPNWVSPVTSDQIVRVRARKYLVKEVVPPRDIGQDTLVRLTCLEDDAQGEALEVLWEREIDARLEESAFRVGRAFDPPRLFSAYLHALRWNCVTATDPELFQAPYRAGIQVKDYQLEPLFKALQLPRVNLFIADDVGLGKTIEAGLILREMIMRQRVGRTLIVCPPSVVRQWQDEMDRRFGLTFTIFDRAFVARCRRERGYAINPWTTHHRFIISQALLRDEAYAAPLRDWLQPRFSGSLLILDEAHNAAPAADTHYAIDSKFTRQIRELAPRFEHKLFLSATPHNGHSNSFAALLEILDPQRFCRGIPISDPGLLEKVMVRRLKSDLRAFSNDFPLRRVIPIPFRDLPESAPELRLSLLLQRYRQAREARFQHATSKGKAGAMLVFNALQKRLLSSIEAFANTLAVHRESLEKEVTYEPDRDQLDLLTRGLDRDDDRAEWSEEDLAAAEKAQMRAASARGRGVAPTTAEEQALLAEMSTLAAAARHRPDPRIQWLTDWIREHQCPDLGRPGARWNDRRVLIFTEYTDTKRYLERQLGAAIAGSDNETDRIEVFHGGIGEEKREHIINAFNADPADAPLRILIATDAAREGVNLQNHCADLFHFDVPWNPSRMEQRNGRIDRKLQRSPEVRCHYFLFEQRVEDRVLATLHRKTNTILAELGTMSPVLERNFDRLLEEGILHQKEQHLVRSIEEGALKTRAGSKSVVAELETQRRTEQLAGRLDVLRGLLQESKKWLNLDDRHFRDAVDTSLQILGSRGLIADESIGNDAAAVPRWRVPDLARQSGAGPGWAVTLDSLRARREKDQDLLEWRRKAPILPVVFHDPGTLDGAVAHLHLEQRFVRRLLGRFTSQGFTADQLSRTCVCLTGEAVPRVILLGRLSLFGNDAARLHDVLVTASARWSEPAARGRGKLSPQSEDEEREILALLEEALATPRFHRVPAAVRERLREAAPRDLEEMSGQLERMAASLAKRAAKKLADRGAQEAREMVRILQKQQRLIGDYRRKAQDELQLSLPFNEMETRQLEAEKRHWQQRLAQLETELEAEPERIKRGYEVRAKRFEIVGLVYLWPESA